MSTQYNGYDPRSPRDEQGRAQGRGAMGWKVLAGVLALAVIALVVLLVLGQRAKDPQQASPTTAAPSPTAAPTTAQQPAATTPAPAPTTTNTTDTTATPEGASWADAGCNGTKGSTGSPAAALAQVTWKPFLSAAIPSSPELGPTKTDTVVRRCYQHSPAGAVIAAANFVYAPLAPNGDKVVKEQWTPGPGRDKALADLAQWSGSTASIAAYRLNGCTAQACNVELVASASGKYSVGAFPLIWKGGDWMVDGSVQTPEPGLVASIPPGFTAWGARS